jgi:hypothetical protein
MTLYIVFIVAAIVVGLLRRGNLLYLTNLQIRHWWLLALGVLARFPLMFSESFSQAVAGWLGASLQIGGLLAILIFTVLNRQLKGTFLISLGNLLTLIAVVVNGGYMPGNKEVYLALLKYYGLTAEAQALESAGPITLHAVLLTSHTNLWYLTDVIPIPRIISHPYVVSIGDILVGCGMFCIVVWGMCALPASADVKQ